MSRFALVGLVTLSGCVEDEPAVAEGEWLAVCGSDSDCVGGFLCLCGLCAPACEQAGECAEWGALVACAPAAWAASACGELVSGSACLPACAGDGECADRGLRCVEGYCTAPEPMDAAVVDARAADASGRDAAPRRDARPRRDAGVESDGPALTPDAAGDGPVPDAAVPDVGSPDAGEPDAAQGPPLDLGSDAPLAADVPLPDVAVPDASPVDVGDPDAASPDAAPDAQ